MAPVRRVPAPPPDPPDGPGQGARRAAPGAGRRRQRREGWPTTRCAPQPRRFRPRPAPRPHPSSACPHRRLARPQSEYPRGGRLNPALARWRVGATERQPPPRRAGGIDRRTLAQGQVPT
eukprot:scaffold921_cov101-Isochrysis_galbana.AAC.2